MKTKNGSSDIPVDRLEWTLPSEWSSGNNIVITDRQELKVNTGYGNVPYFIKQFESITRQTPKEYRISLLQGSENRIKSSTFDAR